MIKWLVSLFKKSPKEKKFRKGGNTSTYIRNGIKQTHGFYGRDKGDEVIYQGMVCRVKNMECGDYILEDPSGNTHRVGSSLISW